MKPRLEIWDKHNLISNQINLGIRQTSGRNEISFDSLPVNRLNLLLSLCHIFLEIV